MCFYFTDNFNTWMYTIKWVVGRVTHFTGSLALQPRSHKYLKTWHKNKLFFPHFSSLQAVKNYHKKRKGQQTYEANKRHKLEFYTKVPFPVQCVQFKQKAKSFPLSVFSQGPVVQCSWRMTLTDRCLRRPHVNIGAAWENCSMAAWHLQLQNRVACKTADIAAAETCNNKHGGLGMGGCWCNAKHSLLGLIMTETI